MHTDRLVLHDYDEEVRTKWITLSNTSVTSEKASWRPINHARKRRALNTSSNPSYPFARKSHAVHNVIDELSINIIKYLMQINF